MQHTNTVTIDTVRDVAVATFTGDWVGAVGDHTQLERLTQQITAASQNRGVNRLVLDLNTVKMLSSMALGMLISVQRSTREAQKEMVLCGVRPELRRLFQAANLEQLFQFQPDRTAALGEFGA